MKTISHREYLTRLKWLDQQWNEPNRTDHYLMQIACEVRRVLSKNPNRITSEQFEMKFKRERRSTKTNVTSMAQRAKAVWLARLNVKPGDIIHKEIPADG